MRAHPTPKYFVGRDGAEGEPDGSADAAPPLHVVDAFAQVGQRGNAPDLAVVLDCLGGLRLVAPEDLPEAMRGALAYHELARGSAARRVAVRELFLFRADLLEQPARATGHNDPVFLYGTLYGPFPSVAAARAVEGQLTVTRQDLIEGLVRGAPHAFRYAPEAGGLDSRRCFHMALPGGDEGDIRRGAGVVLAYPLLPLEVIVSDCANESVVSRFLHSALAALKEDLEREGVSHPLRSTALPVPSRAALERQLEAEGYRVEGDTAVQTAARGEGLRGLLAGVLGSLAAERLDLPRGAAVDEFLDLAGRSIDALPDWPSSRALALRERITACRPVPPSPGATDIPARTPPAAASRDARPTPRRTPRPPGQGPPDWMRDFVAAHRAAGAPPPRLTPADEGPERALDWLDDFAPDRPKAGTRRRGRDGGRDRPEWMKDFE